MAVLEPLADVIARHLASEAGDDRVERLIFGTGEPERIADRIDQVARATLGAGVTAARFFRTSVGCVAGVALADGREVVLKAHPPTQSRAYLEAVHRLREALWRQGYPTPRPIAVATADGALWGAEAWLSAGEWRSASDPDVRRAIAHGLANLVRRLRPWAAEDVLLHPWHAVARAGRWPRPHSPIFDFDATAAGAEWIDGLADRASEALAVPAGERVVGHYDFRVEHLRFTGDRITTVWDWDSTHAAPEPVLVGHVAHAFAADWSRADLRRFPTPDEILAFLDEYEAGRGAPFGTAERQTARAACAWALAYTARCTHALSPDARPEPGADDARALLAATGEALLAG